MHVLCLRLVPSMAVLRHYSTHCAIHFQYICIGFLLNQMVANIELLCHRSNARLNREGNAFDV